MLGIVPPFFLHSFILLKLCWYIFNKNSGESWNNSVFTDKLVQDSENINTISWWFVVRLFSKISLSYMNFKFHKKYQLFKAFLWVMQFGLLMYFSSISFSRSIFLKILLKTSWVMKTNLTLVKLLTDACLGLSLIRASSPNASPSL